ncbi:chaperone protein dnaJ mitochondrial-like, partial [Trifolium pratense]
IPKGVQPGQLLVFRGKGLPKHGFFVLNGDQYVRFRVNFPMTEHLERDLIDQIACDQTNGHISSNAGLLNTKNVVLISTPYECVRGRIYKG